MMLRGNYYLAVLLLILPFVANSENLELIKEDAGITIEEGKITGFAAKLRNKTGPYDSCSFKEDETVYAIDHSDNPAILTIKGTANFTANLNTTFIATNTEDETPTQYHAVLIGDAPKDEETSTAASAMPNPLQTEESKINIKLGKDAKFYGAIKESSSIPVIQVEQADVGINNEGLIEGKGDKQKIAVVIAEGFSKKVNIANDGIIIGDLIEGDPTKIVTPVSTTIINNKEITSDLIRVKKITNTKDAQLNIGTLQSSELTNHGTCHIKSIDFSKNDVAITNEENGYIDIADRIRAQSSGKKMTITNEEGATIRIFEGSTVNELNNEGTLQLVLYQAKQRNAILLDVKGKYTNNGTIEIDANEGGLKVTGLLKDVPVLQTIDALSTTDKNIITKNPLIKISNIKEHPNDNKLLLCDLKILALSEAYTKLEDGFSAVDSPIADAMQKPTTAAKKLVATYGSVFDIITSADATELKKELKKYLTEIRPDDINSIAFSLQSADAITLSRVKQRLEQQRKKRNTVIYWSKKRKYNIWMKAAYEQYKTKENNLISSLAASSKIRGIVVGVDTKIFNDRTLFGLLSAYAKTQLSYTREQELSGNSYATGLYGSYVYNKLYIDAMVIASTAKHDNSRMIKDSALTGKVNSKNLAANLFAGTNVNIKKFEIDPKIGLQLNYINLAGYKLENSDASLTETHTKTNFMRIDGILSAKISKRFDYKKAKIYPSLGVTGTFELKNSDSLHTAVFADTKYDTLAKLGMKRYIEYQAGVNFKYHNLTLEINYSRATATGYKADELQAGLRFNM